MKLSKLLILLLFVSSCANEITEEDYFMNEDFTLIDRTESISMNDNHPTTIWTWVIERSSSKGDSVEIAKISNVALTPEEAQNCGCTTTAEFMITSELWYNKMVGDKLHFDYIRKNRFFKIVNDDRLYNIISKPTEKPEPQPQIITPTVSNDLETERKIMELERQKIQVEMELEKLKMK